MRLTDRVREFIDEGHHAQVVTLDGDGTPHLSVAWVGRDGDTLQFGTLFDQRKLRNLRRDPRISLLMLGNDVNPIGLRHYLVLHGRAEIVEGGAPELLADLAHIYLGPDVDFPPMADPPPGFVTRIEVTAISGAGPWEDD